jgi:hypothetical protein
MDKKTRFHPLIILITFVVVTVGILFWLNLNSNQPVNTPIVTTQIPDKVPTQTIPKIEEPLKEVAPVTTYTFVPATTKTLIESNQPQKVKDYVMSTSSTLQPPPAFTIEQQQAALTAIKKNIQ